MGLPASDGVITLRAFVQRDQQAILDARDGEWSRWLGPGSPDPSPTACIEVDGHVVGWIDADPTPDWLQPGEANVGYSVFPEHRGNGYAARALRVLAADLGKAGLRRVVLVIDVDNIASARVAEAAGAQLLANRAMPAFPTSAVYTLECGRHPTGLRADPG